jgi:uncharacterized membrane protein YfcA
MLMEGGGFVGVVVGGKVVGMIFKEGIANHFGVLLDLSE